MPKKMVAVCFFCSEDVQEKHRVDLLASFRKVHQTFWCHKKCFALRAACSFKSILMPELGGPKIRWDKIKPVPKKIVDEMLGRLKK